MKYLITLFVILATAAASATNYRPLPATYTAARVAGKYIGIIQANAANGSSIGNLIFTSVGGGSALETQTFPTTTFQTTYVEGVSTSPTKNASFEPRNWYVCQVIGDGIPSKHGGYAAGVPVDSTGAPIDLSTGDAIPGKNDADFNLVNPFPDRGFSFEIAVTDPNTGQELQTLPVTLGPGETRPIHIGDDHPFNYIVYPIVEGQRGTPGGAGGTSGGTSGGSSGYGGLPAPPSGPPVVTQGNGTTAPGSTPDPATSGDVQGEIARLSMIVQAAADAAKSGNNISNRELHDLNDKASAAQVKLDAIAASLASIATSASASASSLSSIATSTATSATNSTVLNGKTDTLISELGSGGSSGTFEGLTADQLGNMLDEREGTSSTTFSNDPDRDEAVVLKQSAFQLKVAELSFHINDLTDHVLGLQGALGLGFMHAQTPWSWSVTVPVVGALNVNVETHFGWVLNLIRSVIWTLLSFDWAVRCIKIVRSAFV